MFIKDLPRIVQLKLVRVALQMGSGHTQRSYQHRDAAQQEDSSAERKEPAQQHEPVFMQQQHRRPNDE